MNTQIEYNGHTIESTTRPKGNPPRWSLEVRLFSNDTKVVRRCRAPNTYPNKEDAVARCMEFGRRIVDGKLRPRNRSAR